MEEREKKMVGLLYKLTNTCPPRTPESFYLGGTRLRDIPHLVDEFIRLWQIEYDKKMNNITIEKGSITVNGTSLTVVNSGINTFSVAIIPYTYEHTVFKNIIIGSIVNLEFDVVGKYVAKLASLTN